MVLVASPPRSVSARRIFNIRRPTPAPRSGPSGRDGLVPLGALRLVVGGLLLVFGLQWLRKAILRASSHKARHDEVGIFTAELAAARDAPVGGAGPVGVRDWYAFTVSFKGVLLEGLEVAFIVVTFGANAGEIPLAVLGAACAVALVALVGLAVRAPLARVPENTLKFVVGIMLTAFGMFWGAEGAGAHWPGADAALLGLVAAVAVFALGLVALLRRPAAAPRPAAVSGGSENRP